MSCKECDIPFRPKGTTVAEHPGTGVNIGYSLCSACYGRARRAGLLGDYDLTAPLHPIGHDDPDPRVRDCARELTTYIYDRRERGIPTEGLNSTKETQ